MELVIYDIRQWRDNMLNALLELYTVEKKMYLF